MAEPVRIALFGFNERAERLFRMFLDGPGGGRCRVVPPEEAEAGCVDMDGPRAEQVWETYRQEMGQPALLLSVREQQREGGIWVRKPIDAQSFPEAVRQLRQALKAGNRPKPETPPAAPAPKAAPTEAKASESDSPATPAPRSEPQETSTAAQGLARATKADCCGRMEDDEYLAGDSDRIHYDPNDYFQGQLTAAVERARSEGTPFRMEVAGRHLVVCPDGRHCYNEFRDALLRPLCIRPSRLQRLAAMPVKAEELKLLEQSDTPRQSLEPLLWSVALWTARGRLPRGISPDMVVSLRRWPNLTRLLPVPDAMRIAALWHQEPTPLMTTARELEIPIRHVFGFYVAADSLGLIRTHEHEGAARESAPRKGRERGLLGRLLHRLRGKTS